MINELINFLKESGLEDLINKHERVNGKKYILVDDNKTFVGIYENGVFRTSLLCFNAKMDLECVLSTLSYLEIENYEVEFHNYLKNQQTKYSVLANQYRDMMNIKLRQENLKKSNYKLENSRNNIDIYKKDILKLMINNKTGEITIKYDPIKIKRDLTKLDTKTLLEELDRFTNHYKNLGR